MDAAPLLQEEAAVDAVAEDRNPVPRIPQALR